MFVFKAAVVGAGTMGGEIAQVISSAGIPVVLKDIDHLTRAFSTTLGPYLLRALG